MSASTRCPEPIGRPGGFRLPASPVVFAAAALAQRVITAKQRNRESARRGKADDGGRAAGRNAACAREEAGDENRAEAEAAEFSTKHERQAGCRRGRCRRGGRRCCSAGRPMLSLGVAGVSVMVMARAFQEMTAAETTLDPHAPQETSHLVTTGPYSFSRNPLYLAEAGLLWAHALWLGSPRALLPVGGFVLALDNCQIPLEEAALEDKFGKKFRQYAEQVPRWLGR